MSTCATTVLTISRDVSNALPIVSASCVRLATLSMGPIGVSYVRHPCRDALNAITVLPATNVRVLTT